MDGLGSLGGVSITFLLFALFIALSVFNGVHIVPQSKNYVIERFGRYRLTLKAGLNFIVPFLDRVAARLSILERQLTEQKHSVITRDNVTIDIKTTIFFRILDAAKATYRIMRLEPAINNAVTGTVRSIIGSIEFDEVQSHRDAINARILESLQETAAGWGVEITRTEVIDVQVDEDTRRAMQQQLNAERERRATVMEAEGRKQSAQLAADAELYTAQKTAEAKRTLADADAYATKVIAESINNGGDAAIQFEIMKRQVEAMGSIANADNTKLLLLPSNIVDALSGLKDTLGAVKSGGS